MSLQVWLPFTDGTLKQQGVSNITVTSSNYTVNNSGKLGKCIKTKNATGLDLGYNGNQINTGSISFGGWFKFNKDEIGNVVNNARTYDSTYNTPTGQLIGNDSYGGIGIVWNSNNMYTSSPFSSLLICSNIRTSTVNRTTSSYTVVFDTWVHIFVTFNKDTGALTLYINGSKFSETIFSSFSDARSYNLILNYAGTYGGNGPGLYIPFDCNDVRIYDHCLSPMEVKRISRGLVLHYPLNRNGWGQENLATCTTSQYTINASSTSNYNYFWINSSTLEPNTTYTFSAEVEVSDNITQCTIYNYTNSSNYGSITHIFPADGKRHSWTFTTTSGAIGLIAYAGNSGATAGHSAVYRNIKVEKGSVATPYIPRNNETIYNTLGLNSNIEYDTSGFCNNGVRTGTFTWSSDVPKYSVSTQFNGAEVIAADSLPLEALTISCWVKVTTIPSGYGIIYADTNTQTALGFYNGNSFITSCVVSANVALLGTTFKANEWNHIVLIKTGTNTRDVYCNGVLLTNSGTNNWVHNGNNLQLGKREYSGGNAGYLNGQISDFRAYATALSADDVKSLYQNCATIDSNGTIHGQIRT